MTTAESLQDLDTSLAGARTRGGRALEALIQRLSQPGAATAAPPVTRRRAAVASTTRWSRDYARYLRLSDSITVIASVVVGAGLWMLVSGTGLETGQIALNAVLGLVWLAALAFVDSRSERVTGTGTTEFKKVADAALVVVAIIAVGAVFVPHPSAKGALLFSIPMGLAFLLLERAFWREWLKARRRSGQFKTDVVLVGSPTSVRKIRDELVRASTSEFAVAEECVSSGDAETLVDDVRAALASTGADTVIVTGTDDLPPERVKEISWSLEAGREHLLLAPSITDVAGPRISTRAACGLPLIHVETPRLGRPERVTKRVFDMVGSAALILALAPVLGIIALLVKATSPGPVLYRQQRVGHHGLPFHMLKFRSMRTGADQELAALLAEQGGGDQPLFKVKDDPRITRVGRVLRKYSLDELPQLFNVLGGSMSLVGPRPQVADEVAMYTSTARRRLLARPGMTGLWQVSGRSTLDWDQSVRLDLYYVENWSPFTDLGILFRTFHAVVAPGETAH